MIIECWGCVEMQISAHPLKLCKSEWNARRWNWGWRECTEVHDQIEIEEQHSSLLMMIQRLFSSFNQHDIGITCVTCLPILFPTLVILFPTLVIFFPRHGFFFSAWKFIFSAWKFIFLAWKNLYNQLKKSATCGVKFCVSRVFCVRPPHADFAKLCAFAWDIFAHKKHRNTQNFAPHASAKVCAVCVRP